MLSTVLSAAVYGMDGLPVTVEVDLQRGLRCFHIVGLPSPAVRESRERVASAIRNAGFELPERRITVNLAPADLPKEGAAFDLAIALGILQASGQISADPLDRVCVLGELALDGALRPTRGVLPIAIAMRRQGIQRMLVSAANATEAMLVPGIDVVACKSVGDAIDQLLHPIAAASVRSASSSSATSATSGTSATPATSTATPGVQAPRGVHFGHVFGQALAKRALSIAAAGGHHLLMIGPPGIGKSMLARCMPGLLPALSTEEALDVRQVLSVCGQHEAAASPVVARPFRAPHHTITVPALVGGGRPVVPGEITRSIHGVLFLDEIPEFSRGLLDLLRQPLEDGTISLSRANSQVCFPARFQLLAAMNPCPCGNYTHPRKPCRCTPGEVQRYRGRISGPILDRIDLCVELGIPSNDEMQVEDAFDEHLLQRVAAARTRQNRRYADVPGVYCNAQVQAQERQTRIRLRTEARSFLRRAMSRWDLSVRAHERTLAVARSIADLDGSSDVNVQHVAEALQYRLHNDDAVQ